MKYDSLTLERLKELLAYDPETGIFTWRQRPFRNSRRQAGDVAGLLKGKGYRYIGIDNRTYLASQLAWFYVHGEWAKGEVGVRNRQPSDLRIENLYEMKTAPGKHDFNTREGKAQYRRAKREANPGLFREYGLKRFYGIDLAEYQRLFVAQGGVCAICKKPETAKSRWNPKGEAKWLSVDHNHETGAVRGLLCYACNSMLGQSGDDAALLRAGAAYLDRYAPLGAKDLVVTEGFPDFKCHVIRDVGDPTERAR